MAFCNDRSGKQRIISVFQLLTISMAFLLITLISGQAFAAKVIVAFDPSTDNRVVGHKMYYGRSTTYSDVLDLGTSRQVEFSNLQEGITYYFAATAYDRYGNESAFSNILSYKVPDTYQPPDNNTNPGNSNTNQSLFNTVENFETYSAGAQPSYWYDSKAWSSMDEDPSLFRVYDVSGNKVFGTTSTLVNINSHHVKSYIDNFSSFEYTGRMMMTHKDGGIGVTFLSHYPFTDAYYRLRCDSWSLSFHISPRFQSTARVYGITDSGVIPKPNTWYRFRIQVQNTGNRINILAKIWPQNTSEPSQWQINAYDNTSNRLTSGTFGVWSGWAGNKYWDDLKVVK